MNTINEMKIIKTIIFTAMCKIDEALCKLGIPLLKDTKMEHMVRNALNWDAEALIEASGVVWQRYMCIKRILKKNSCAGHVFDIALAGYRYPDFLNELKKKTGAENCVLQGFTVDGNMEPSYEELCLANNILERIFKTDKRLYPFYMRSINMDDRLFGYLNGDNTLPHTITGYVSLVIYDQETEELCGVEDTVKQVEEQLGRLQLTYVEGNAASGRKSVVIRAAKNLNRNLLIIELANTTLKELQNTEFEICRELYLNEAYLCIHGLSEEWLKKQECSRRDFLSYCEKTYYEKGFSICFCTEPGVSLIEVSNQIVSGVIMTKMGRQERISLWKFFAKRYGLSLSAELAGSKYRLEAGEIKKACEMLGVVYDNTYPLSEREVSEYCQKVLPASAVRGSIVHTDGIFTFEDLKLPTNEKKIMRDICNYVNFSYKVFDTWNMKSRFPYGKSISVLFYGPSGTGKTMAAHILAKELGYPLYHVDLSQIADKYIGETEKHLQQVFDHANKINTILFFDEADAIFGKRSDIRDSKDRHANTQVAYLLQKIEEYDGIVILATNLKENIDTAFFRRMKYVIHFAMPDENIRREIWESSFAKEVPTDVIDYEYLSINFDLSGGNIKNIVLMASFYAAAEQCPVGMQHIVRALKYEYQKMGKFLLREDFGKYAYLDV